MEKNPTLQLPAYQKITAAHIAELKSIIGEAHVLQHVQDLQPLGSDETDELHHAPEVAVKPANTAEISRLVQWCNQHQIPITTRGAGTGLSGGAVPVKGGLVLLTSRLNRIIEIDKANLQATVEPGVINQVFQEAVAQEGLFYPPDPASKGSCYLGGNVSENSGGPKCVKYGVTKDYILNLEVVLATGEIIWTGANTLKNSTGYNLTGLMIGSEGTLGIITKIVVKLLPLPKHQLLLLVPFRQTEQACQAVSAVFHAGLIPSAIEFMERDALEWVSRFVESNMVSLKDDHAAHLLIEVDGNDIDALMRDMEHISSIMEQYDIDEILFAESAAQKDELWKLRRRINEAVKANAISREQDTVVKRAFLPQLVSGVKDIGKKYQFQSVCYGHAGDGNLHIRIIKGDMSEDKWNGEHMRQAVSEIFLLCKTLGGTISGEHGIGYIQKEFMPLLFSEGHLHLQKQIKKTFDPNFILNPDKMFPW